MLIYFSAPSLTSFNSMFIYETLALAFLGMCIVAALRSAIEKSPSDRRRWFIVAVLCIFATVITHHVTSYMLTAVPGPGGGRQQAHGLAQHRGQVRHPRAHLRALGRRLDLLHRAGHDHLLQPHGGGHRQTASRTLTKSGSSDSADQRRRRRSATSSTGTVGLLAITVLIAVGSLAGLEAAPAPSVDHRHDDRLPSAGSSPLAIRLGTPDGQELAGRAATYIYIPVSVLAALALTRLVNSAPGAPLGRRRHRRSSWPRSSRC